MNLEWEQHGDVWKSKGGMFEIRRVDDIIAERYHSYLVTNEIGYTEIGYYDTHFDDAEACVLNFATELLTTLNKELNND